MKLLRRRRAEGTCGEAVSAIPQHHAEKRFRRTVADESVGVGSLFDRKSMCDQTVDLHLSLRAV